MARPWSNEESKLAMDMYEDAKNQGVKSLSVVYNEIGEVIGRSSQAVLIHISKVSKQQQEIPREDVPARIAKLVEENRELRKYRDDHADVIEKYRQMEADYREIIGLLQK